MPPEQLPPARRTQWGRVTWYSQLLAIVLFVGIFVLGYYLGGLQTQAAAPSQFSQIAPTPTATTQGTSTTVSNATGERAPDYEVQISDPQVHLSGREVYFSGYLAPVAATSTSGIFSGASIRVYCENWDHECVLSGTLTPGNAKYTLHESWMAIATVSKWTDTDMTASGTYYSVPVKCEREGCNHEFTFTVDFTTKKVTFTEPGVCSEMGCTDAQDLMYILSDSGVARL